MPPTKSFATLLGAWDRRLGDLLGEAEVVIGQGFQLGEARLAESPLQRSLLTGGLLQAKERGQHFQHRAAFASRLVEHFAVSPGDLGQLQFSQIPFQPCLEIVITSSHERPPRFPCRNGRKWRDRRVPARSRRSVRGAGAWAAWAWAVAAAGAGPAEGSRHRRRRRLPTPGPA